MSVVYTKMTSLLEPLANFFTNMVSIAREGIDILRTIELRLQQHNHLYARHITILDHYSSNINAVASPPPPPVIESNVDHMV